MTQLLMLQYNNIYREEAYCDRIGIQLKTKCKAFYVHMAHDSHHLSSYHKIPAKEYPKVERDHYNNFFISFD